MRTFSLGAGKDTVVFANDATNNGKDTITGFTAGARGDELDFTAFITSSLTVGELNVTTGQSLSANNIYQTTVSGAIKSKDYGGTEFDELFDTSGKAFVTTGTSSGNKEVIVVKGDDVTQIYYVSATAGTLTSDMVTLVAVIDNDGSGVALTTDNFVVA